MDYKIKVHPYGVGFPMQHPTSKQYPLTNQILPSQDGIRLECWRCSHANYFLKVYAPNPRKEDSVKTCSMRLKQISFALREDSTERCFQCSVGLCVMKAELRVLKTDSPQEKCKAYVEMDDMATIDVEHPRIRFTGFFKTVGSTTPPESLH